MLLFEVQIGTMVIYLKGRVVINIFIGISLQTIILLTNMNNMEGIH